MNKKKENLYFHMDPTHAPTNTLILRKLERKLLPPVAPLT